MRNHGRTLLASVHRLMPSVHGLLPSIHRLMCSLHRLLPSVHRLMLSVPRLMCSLHRLLPSVHRLMLSVHSSFTWLTGSSNRTAAASPRTYFRSSPCHSLLQLKHPQPRCPVRRKRPQLDPPCLRGRGGDNQDTHFKHQSSVPHIQKELYFGLLWGGRTVFCQHYHIHSQCCMQLKLPVAINLYTTAYLFTATI